MFIASEPDSSGPDLQHVIAFASYFSQVRGAIPELKIAPVEDALLVQAGICPPEMARGAFQFVPGNPGRHVVRDVNINVQPESLDPRREAVIKGRNYLAA